MSCKHKQEKGKTTKYYYCQVKEKAIEEYECKNCMMKLPSLPKEIEEIFGKGFTRKEEKE